MVLFVWLTLRAFPHSERGYPKFKCIKVWRSRNPKGWTIAIRINYLNRTATRKFAATNTSDNSNIFPPWDQRQVRFVWGVATIICTTLLIFMFCCYIDILLDTFKVVLERQALKKVWTFGIIQILLLVLVCDRLRPLEHEY